MSWCFSLRTKNMELKWGLANLHMQGCKLHKFGRRDTFCSCLLGSFISYAATASTGDIKILIAVRGLSSVFFGTTGCTHTCASVSETKLTSVLQHIWGEAHSRDGGLLILPGLVRHTLKFVLILLSPGTYSISSRSSCYAICRYRY